MMDNKNYQVSSEGLVFATTVDEKNMMKSVVDKIKEYVKNYDGIMLDYDGESASIYMGWDNFTDVEKDYAFDYEFFVIYNTSYCLSKDNIIVRELLVDDYGITVFVELDK
jgi:hypothetical protein